MDATGKAKTVVTIEAVVTRADGTVENLGVIARHHPNPFIRFWDRVRGLGRIHKGA